MLSWNLTIMKFGFGRQGKKIVRKHLISILLCGNVLALLKLKALTDEIMTNLSKISLRYSIIICCTYYLILRK